MSERDGPTYENPDAPIDDRVRDLLDRMTPEEKVGQLVGMITGTLQGFGGESTEYTVSDVEGAIREHNIGAVSPFGIGYSPHNAVGVVSRITNRLQKTARNETRLGIPLLIPVDSIHGYGNVKGSTVFPHNLGMAATWDPQLVREAARVAAAEMRVTGATQTYSPMADVVRDPRWGRTYETYGESPHLVGEMVAAEVEGLQWSDSNDRITVAATAKHFPAHGAPARGEDRAAIDISPVTLHRVFLPPFRRAIEAGAASMIASDSSVNGEPVHSSRRLLTELLREQLEFEGITCDDWLGVRSLSEDFRTAATLPDAIRQAVRAGIDFFPIGGEEYAALLLDAIDAGDVPERRLDESVRRVLAIKFRLGLFEDPFVDVNRAFDVVGREDHRKVALECARRSITLLKNDDVLPLDPDAGSVLVTGPNADSIDNLCGGGTVVGLGRHHGSTVVNGISDIVGEARVRHERGASITELEDVERVRAAAAAADAAVVVLGENWYIHEFGPESITGPTGEFPTRNQLALPEAQRRLFHAVSQTGVPTVAVLVGGRPLAVLDVAADADALLMGYLPGLEGGRALAEIIFGEVNPSGKLPISMPRSIGDLPVVHDWLPHPTVLGERSHPPSYDPLFEFGKGLSYSDFEYTSIEVESADATRRGVVDVRVTVSNRGPRRGDEVVQLFVEDLVSSRTTPVRELKAFDRVTIDAGESECLHFELETETLGVVQPDGSSVVEPGEFEVTANGLSTRFSID